MTADAALESYRAKRDFRLTAEPRGGGRARAGGQRFVVQKHWASQLHYDFRLELDGTLKSWAVPKGPSLDPLDKRLAVQVEDHPLAYARFEGEIAAGQYGAGRVIVWDKGHWVPSGDARAGLRDGHLKFELHGLKLQGRWALVRLQGRRGERQPPWLLLKEKDALARPADVYAVVDALPDSVARHKLPALPRRRAASRPSAASAPAPSVPLPERLSPQLATLASQAPADADGWLYEIKFDGYRLLTRVAGQGARRALQLFTRNGHDWTDRLPALQQALQQLDLPEGWYDGEIVVMDQNGVPDFGALQQAFEAQAAQSVVYYLFDVPYCAGHDLRAQPLQARRALLQSLLEGRDSERVFFSAEFDAPAGAVLQSACTLGLEGLIAKRRDAPYVSQRSDSWLKLKCGQRQEFVVVGFTAQQGRADTLGALLLGMHDAQGRLCYAGKVGTGFDAATRERLMVQLAGLVRTHSPLDVPADVGGQPRWVQPSLVAEVGFAAWTQAGRIRHAVFKGLRSDKPARGIVRERAVAPAVAVARRPARSASTALPPGLRVTHGERVIDPSSGLTKLDVVAYYARVAALLMPHVQGRPVSLVRAPDGFERPLFFQKHAAVDKLPGMHALDPALDPGHAPLLAVASERGLLSAAQWNMVELHSMNALARRFDRPDRLVFDLDPGEGLAWPRMQEGAQLVHALLQQLGLPAFLKTSGGKGLHVVVPIQRRHSWAAAKGFAQALVQHLARTMPDRFVAKSGPRNRVGKIFVDYLRNGQGATTVCAWSARARPGMGISVPLAWDELPTLQRSDQWDLRNVHERVAIGNAPWAGYARAAKSLRTAMQTIGFEGD
jgi:bifunctional non-homologous end joining protein LigD